MMAKKLSMLENDIMRTAKKSNTCHAECNEASDNQWFEIYYGTCHKKFVFRNDKNNIIFGTSFMISLHTS